MSGTDRGEERRRYLRAVRTGEEPESSPEPADADDRPEPATDGGTVAQEAPAIRCLTCDRTYLTAPVRCDDCGAQTFVEPTRFASGDPE